MAGSKSLDVKWVLKNLEIEDVSWSFWKNMNGNMTVFSTKDKKEGGKTLLNGVKRNEFLWLNELSYRFSC